MPNVSGCPHNGNPARHSHHQFGTKAIKFLVCSICGVCVSAYLPDGDRACANVTANALHDHDAFGPGFACANVTANALHDHDAFGPGFATDYGSEEETGKRQLRRQKWTPATLTITSKVVGAYEIIVLTSMLSRGGTWRSARGFSNAPCAV